MKHEVGRLEERTLEGREGREREEEGGRGRGREGEGERGERGVNGKEEMYKLE